LIITLAFLVDFRTFCTSGNTKEYSTKRVNKIYRFTLTVSSMFSEVQQYLTGVIIPTSTASTRASWTQICRIPDCPRLTASVNVRLWDSRSLLWSEGIQEGSSNPIFWWECSQDLLWTTEFLAETLCP